VFKQKGEAMTQTIVRVQKDKDNPYVMIDKRIFQDKRLSLKAKGLMGYLLCKPDNWQVQLGELVSGSTDGVTAVRSTLKELEKFGYAEYAKIKDDKTGKFQGSEWIIYERPKTPDRDAENLYLGVRSIRIARPRYRFSVYGFSAYGKSNTINNDLTNKERTNIKDSVLTDEAKFLKMVSLWEKFMPKKPTIAIRTPKTGMQASLEKKLASRLKDEEFKTGIVPALKKAASSPYLCRASWFTLEYLLRNDTNWRKVSDGLFDSFDEQERRMQPTKPTSTLAKLKQDN